MQGGQNVRESFCCYLPEGVTHAFSFSAAFAALADSILLPWSGVRNPIDCLSPKLGSLVPPSPGGESQDPPVHASMMQAPRGRQKTQLHRVGLQLQSFYQLRDAKTRRVHPDPPSQAVAWSPLKVRRGRLFWFFASRPSGGNRPTRPPGPAAPPPRRFSIGCAQFQAASHPWLTFLDAQQQQPRPPPQIKFLR